MDVCGGSTSGLISCRARNQQVIAVPEAETLVHANDYEGMTPDCSEIGYDDSFLDETPTLDAIAGETGGDCDCEDGAEAACAPCEEELPPDARPHYGNDDYDMTERLSPEEVAEIQDMPAYDVTTVLTGNMQNKIDLARERSDYILSKRQELVQLETDAYHIHTIALHDDSTVEEAERRVRESIVQSGHLMVDLDGIAEDLERWQAQEGPMPPGVAEELLARMTVAHGTYPPVIAELGFLLDPNAQDNRREAQLIRAAEDYKAQYEAMEAYLKPLEETYSDYVELVNATMTCAATYDVCSTILFLRGTRGMGSMWKVSAAGKLAGLPSALGVMDQIDWKAIGTAYASGQAWQTCIGGAETEQEQEVCNNMHIGGDAMAREVAKLTQLAERIVELAER